MESPTVQDAAILGTLEVGTVNVRVHVCVQSPPFVKKRARRYTVIHRTGQEHFDPYLSLSEAIMTGRWGLLTGITCVCVQSHPSVKMQARRYTQSSTVQGRNISTHTSPYQKLY